MNLKQKVSAETGQPVPKCWVTECNYTVALCGTGEHAMYQVTAPRGRAPFAYTPAKNEVKRIIINHKAIQNDCD